MKKAIAEVSGDFDHALIYLFLYYLSQFTLQLIALKMRSITWVVLSILFCMCMLQSPGGGGGEGVFRISSDGDDRMGAKKSKPKKIPKAFNKPPETLDQTLTPQKSHA